MKDASMIDRARSHLLTSPSGKMMKIVHREMVDSDRDLMEVHGGLQMLAAPLQIILAIMPLLVLRFMPGDWLVPNRLLELAMVGYLASLAVILRTFPNFAARFVGAASRARRFLVNVTRINWMFPVLLLWLLGRVIVGFAFDLMQPDVTQWQQIALEKSIMEAFLPVDVQVPETSFLDMLVALAVLPLATFTTMAVLGGGRYDLPDWLVNSEAKWEDLPPEDGQLLLGDGTTNSDEEGGVKRTENPANSSEQDDSAASDSAISNKKNNTNSENAESDEKSVLKGNKVDMLAALAKAKDVNEMIFGDED